MHYLLKAIMIHIGLVLGLGNIQWSQSKFISIFLKVQSIYFSLLNFSLCCLLEWIVVKEFVLFHQGATIDDLLDVLVDISFVIQNLSYYFYVQVRLSLVKVM